MAKTQRKTNQSLKKPKKGKKKGCGCGIGGGKKQRKTRSKKQIKGGSPNIQTLPIRYYYQLNTEEGNPQNPSLIGNSTKQFLGGNSKKNRNKKNTKNKQNKQKNKSIKNKKLIKGGMVSEVINGSQVNVTSGFGTSMGSNMLYNTQNISSNTMDDITNQPAGNINNEHTYPLA